MPKPTLIPLTGGLGNQLFQYAYGRKLEIVDKKLIIFNTSFFTNQRANQTSTKDTPRPFLLDRFNINPSAKFSPNPENRITKIFKKILYKITGNYPLYQSEKYFASIKNIILQEFTLKDPLSTQAQNITNNIRLQTSPVSIHVRRGDYVNNTNHPICNSEYYYKAMHHIKSKVDNPFFFVFSDDIQWVKDNLEIHNAVFVSNGQIQETQELILMSQCSHNIIANSTFSWWGAYLNQNSDKIVVAPVQWTTKKTSTELDILPENWIRI
jgi:hypothetical protein